MGLILALAVCACLPRLVTPRPRPRVVHRATRLQPEPSICQVRLGMQWQSARSALGQPDSREPIREGKLERLEWAYSQTRLELRRGEVISISGGAAEWDGHVLARIGDRGKSLKARLRDDPRMPLYKEEIFGKCGFSFRISDLWNEPGDYTLMVPLTRGQLTFTVSNGDVDLISLDSPE